LQQPEVQVLPAQQRDPTVPHTWQVPHDAPAAVQQTIPAEQPSLPFPARQHCSPACPHDAHVPALQ
jgi:hypothetical protein